MPVPSIWLSERQIIKPPLQRAMLSLIKIYKYAEQKN